MTVADEHILIIKHGAFGDIVQSDGALRDIRAHHPNARITVMTARPFVRIMQRCPHIDQVIRDDREPFWKIGRLLALRRTIREAKFDKVYDLQISDRSDLYRRLFFRGVPWCGRPRRTFPMIGRRVMPRPGLVKFVDQLEADGVAATHSLRPDVSWMVEDVSQVLSDAGVNKPYVALIPGCSARHPQKRWPHYDQLAAALIERGYDVVTAPGPDEIDLCRSIPGKALMKPDGVLNWFELAGVLHGAAFIVGNDTGPSHIASCLNKPGLALFGSHTTVERTGIKRGEFDAIEVEDLEKLSVERVLGEVLRRLGDQA
jgi:ADP-heptose:LPS heptosyltransferase